MRLRDNEDGAILILALIIVSVLATATLAVAQLGFANPKASHTYADQQRLTDALDSGLQAAVENARLNGTPEPACGPDIPAPVPPDPDPPAVDVLTLDDADGPVGPSATPSTAPITIVVSCKPIAPPKLYSYEARAYLNCPAPPAADAKPEYPMLAAKVSYVDIDGEAITRIARITSWRLITPTSPGSCAS